MTFPRWPIRHLAPFPRLRNFGTSVRCGRDLGAKYRYRAPRPTDGEEYVTASTVPVISSIQAVPPPSATTSSAPSPSEINLAQTSEAPFVGRKATILPAMKPLHPEPLPVKGEERGRAIKVMGIVVPPKPTPPESDECCMSGCVNCVYTLYADDLLAYNESLSTALSLLRSSGTPPTSWPDEIRAFAEKGKMKGDAAAAAFGGRRAVTEGDGGDGVGKVTREEIMRDVLVDVDPALRAFLELENKIKARQ